MADLDMMALEIEELKAQNARLAKDVEIQKDISLELRAFRKEFVKENGYVPKIVNRVRENVRKDLGVIKKEIIAEITLINNRISKLPCISPDTSNEELLKAAGCKIVNVGDKIYPGEKEMK
jgi:FtsZ-binding cell division protein ZapB